MRHKTLPSRRREHKNFPFFRAACLVSFLFSSPLCEILLKICYRRYHPTAIGECRVIYGTAECWWGGSQFDGLEQFSVINFRLSRVARHLIRIFCVFVVLQSGISNDSKFTAILTKTTVKVKVEMTFNPIPTQNLPIRVQSRLKKWQWQLIKSVEQQQQMFL